jgi:anaerobic sulfite reductase subunit C
MRGGSAVSRPFALCPRWRSSRVEWTADAAASLGRVPFFVRRLARRRIEEAVAAAGRELVTITDVLQARNDQLSRVNPLGTQPDLPDPAPVALGASEPAVGPTGLTEAQIRRIETLAENSSYESRFASVKGCGGAVGCPLAIQDVEEVSRRAIAAIASPGLAEALAARIRGPVLSHHKLKLAVAGCPNCCSEPQIKDFALVARAWPARGGGACGDCGQCVATCRESAVLVTPDGPVFDLTRCVGCGACAEVCPSEAVVIDRRGWDVLVGGQLGRHPRFARPLATCVSTDEALRLLDVCLDRFVRDGRTGEKLGQVIERVGLEPTGE